ncbi:hypothetical protein V9T40_004968 [Parthenolecanium corni]|uniref:Receptor-type tyrosine-protein phosphatase N2 n=1 Tax=Parthenolecanium corni TaxID=536013 RepID=A0AAN9TFF7_9HEMI
MEIWRLGCLYSSQLCDSKLELCFNDFAFGRCVYKLGYSPSDLYRYTFKYDDLEKLKEQLEELRELGYAWKHSYTQCIIQTQLNSVKFGVPFNGEICEPMLEKENPDPIRELQYEQTLAFHKQPKTHNIFDSASEGIIKYGPDDEMLDGRVLNKNEFYKVQPDYENELINQLRLESKSKSDVRKKSSNPTASRFRKSSKSTAPRYRGTPLYLPIHNRDKFETGQNELEEDGINYDSSLDRNKWSGLAAEEPNVSDEILEKALEAINREKQKAYSEGGPMFISNKKDDYDDLVYEKILDQYGSRIFGFQRSERLDVKKPGPDYKVNNYAFGNDHLSSNDNNAPEEAGQYSIVNADYTYIELKNPIKNWEEVKHIVYGITDLLHIPEDSIDDIKSEVSEIAFRIVPNRQNLNASEVAKKIDSHRSEINDRLNIDITSVGIGDKDKLPTAVHMANDNRLYMLTFVVCGVIGAVLVSSATLYFLKKQSRLKDKLFVPHDKDIGRDYQELCKSKATSKTSQEGTTSGQRITSLSRESDNSPSSRSSTSSWSEDPMTNMDITTGHMVLAYMEDHLTNKARLDTEWAALCAYDADPCSVAIAQLPENIRKNRYVNALPYDHARVILNALSNVNGCDYINASTITDHDPRNAAYIASQGPMENTVCDFWQMIWEQGCVVIVMLTRLVENDTSMCHRYWPLEGAELYNIYEVYLVSEHIWCDDFLVRSFYLKNLKTTETRTVTQFHFLTWPEGGIPSATKPLLEFRRKVNKSFRGRSCPIVVHCSDGVGRTGSYLLLDMVLNRISKGAKEIDIAATLEHIRDQRTGAVCTKQQFQFVLSAVAEEVQAVLRALPQQQQSTQDQTSDPAVPSTQSEPVATSSGTTNHNTNQVPGQPSK